MYNFIFFFFRKKSCEKNSKTFFSSYRCPKVLSQNFWSFFQNIRKSVNIWSAPGDFNPPPLQKKKNRKKSSWMNAFIIWINTWGFRHGARASLTDAHSKKNVPGHQNDAQIQYIANSVYLFRKFPFSFLILLFNEHRKLNFSARDAYQCS